MTKFYLYFFLFLSTSLAVAEQNKQPLVLNTTDPLSYFSNVFSSHSKCGKTKIIAQRASKAKLATNFPTQKLDSIVGVYFKDVYTYDNSGRILTESNWNWGTDGWSLEKKDSSIYNADGRLQTYLSIEVIEPDNYIEKKTDYQHNTNEKIELNYSRTKSNQQWDLKSKNTKTYNNSGLLTMELSSQWFSNNWEDYKRTDYEYDNSANLIQETEYSWMYSGWGKSEKTTYTYDVNGDNMDETYFEWDDFTETWTGLYKSEFLRDNNHNITTLISSNFSTTENIFEKSNKVDLNFDLNTLALNVCSNDKINKFGKHKLVSAKMFYFDEIEWIYSGLATLYYSAFNSPTATKSALNNTVKVYPNPASSYILFNLDKTTEQYTVQIINLQGKIVLNQSCANNKPVSIENLSKGLYQYKIVSNNRDYTGKLIIN